MLPMTRYGMFLAIIIPPSRKNKIVCGTVLVSFASSFLASKLPYVSNLSGGTRTIILTLIIASLAAAIFPVKDERSEAQNEE